MTPHETLYRELVRKSLLQNNIDIIYYGWIIYKIICHTLCLQIGQKGLDYDESTFEGQQFKHTILIKISDGGTPSLTSECPCWIDI